MMKIAARRMLRMSVDQSSFSDVVVFSRPRTNSGMTRSLEIMIDSATLATMTIAVAADSPPMKAAMASDVVAAEQRQRQHIEIGAGAVADQRQRRRSAIGSTNRLIATR